MKNLFATMALLASLPLSAFAQRPSPPDVSLGLGTQSGGPTPSNSTAKGRTATGDANVRRATEAVPTPTPEGELQAPKITLPTGPIEPFLVQKENGPFMVMAHSFRGPEAARYAQALVLELRETERLPAYIFFVKVQPGRSNIRGVQPTAPPYARNGDMAAPEKFRNYDEAAVLVGNCKTLEDAMQLLKRVKHLKPTTLDNLPTIYNWRIGRGLSRALITTNPLAAAQNIYSGKGAVPTPPPKPGQPMPFDPSVVTASFQKIRKSDPLIKQMNRGPHNIYKCSGPYLLQVAEYTGRVSVNPKTRGELSDRELNGSPLAAAAEDAEKLADALTKCKFLGKQLQPYVYHDRTASFVYLGPFTSPQDPALLNLTKYRKPGTQRPIDQISEELLKKTSLILVPANELTAVPKD
jgi:hypothetical protein